MNDIQLENELSNALRERADYVPIDVPNIGVVARRAGAVERFTYPRSHLALAAAAVLVLAGFGVLGLLNQRAEDLSADTNLPTAQIPQTTSPVAAGEDSTEPADESGGMFVDDSSPVEPFNPAPLDQSILTLVAWSDPNSWPDGRVPRSGDNVVIPADTNIRLDVDVDVGGLNVLGGLYFDPSTSVRLRSDSNIIVDGVLHAQPASNDVVHVVEFHGSNPEGYVGGGMEPIDSDVGLWVMGTGQLWLEGSPRRGWTLAQGSVAAGDTTVEVSDLSGWSVGDEIVISPSAPPHSDGVDGNSITAGFHKTTIESIEGNRINLATGSEFDHPLVNGRWGAEVLNLSRNVRVEGGEAGHIFVHSERPQHIRWVALEDLGVADALGRYPLHIHHAADGSSGTLIEGVVSNGGRHHAFVPHESNGITIIDTVAYDTSGGDSIWWDEGDETHDLVLDRVLVAGSASSAFYLGRGTNMTIRNSVAVGVVNQFNDAGFHWENGAVGNWTVENITAHNNMSNGIRVWQNSDIAQIVDGYVAYHNFGAAIDQGAYSNRYTYRNGHYYGNLEGGVILRATSSPLPISFEHTVIDSAGISEGAHFVTAESAIPAELPAVLYNVEFRGEVPGKPIFDFYGEDSVHQIRCIDCTAADSVDLVRFNSNFGAGTWLQMIDEDGSTIYAADGTEQSIERPIRQQMGSGAGLTAEYFNDPDLTDLAHSAVLPGLTEQWEYDPEAPSFGMLPAHHSISVWDGSSARYSGQLEISPGDSGEHVFFSRFGGGIRIWIDGGLIVDDWDNYDLNGDFDDPHSAGHNQAVVVLDEGLHDIKVELRDTNPDPSWRGWYFDVFWSEAGRPMAVIPPSQLHPQN